MKKEGKHEQIQKRLVLSDLKEVHHEFKKRYPDCKIGFSKFAELKPKHYVLAGVAQYVCVQYIRI